MKTAEKLKKSASNATTPGETAAGLERRATRRTFPRISSRQIRAERPTSHDFSLVFVSHSEPSTLTHSPTQITPRVPLPWSNPDEKDSGRFGNRPRDEKQSRRPKNVGQKRLFWAESSAGKAASCAERLGVRRLALLAPHRFHRFSGAPPIQRTSQQNAGRLETDGASQPIRAFVFLKDYFLIGF